MPLVKFRITITMEKDGSVRVESINPGAANPLEIIGLLEKVKSEIVMAMREKEDL